MSVHELAKQIRTGQHVPDILDCLAQLSNDEVPTPPKLARAMLDILPDEVWGKADYLWLDPFCKSGIFLRETAARLLDGLSDQIPNFEERRDHIYRDMLWGTSITAMTGMISRRSLYYSRDASGPASVVGFGNPDGNVPFIHADHTFPKKKDGTVAGGCTHCGAPLSLERGVGRENYAYSFIHGAYPTKEMKDLKFDVIVGNPPYQIDDEGGHRPVPVYHKFVDQAIKMNPRYIVMITPSRWMGGGLGLSKYRASMLKDRRIRSIVDYPGATDAFPGVKIESGVSYFLWDRDNEGSCAYSVRRGDIVLGPDERKLNEFDIFVRDPIGLPILRRVLERGEGSFAELVASVRPFGDRLRSNFSDFHEHKRPLDRRLLLVSKGKRRLAWVDDAYVTNNLELAESWKVFLPTAFGDSSTVSRRVLGPPVVAPPGSVATETFVAIGPFDAEVEAAACAHYLRTVFARYLITLRKVGQHNIPSTFTWLPVQDWSYEWTDDELFERYELTDAERAHVQHVVKSMDANAVASLQDYS